MIREQRHAALILEHGLSPRRKLLLLGPPGTGKIMTASVLAGELGIPLFQIRQDALITKYMGETAAKLRQVFDATEQTRDVYFFDEFDAIGSQRGLANDVGEIRRVLNSALFRRFDDVFHYEWEKQWTGVISEAEQLLEQVNAHRTYADVHQLGERMNALQSQWDQANDRYMLVQGYKEAVQTTLTNLQQMKAQQDTERLEGIEPLARFLYDRLNAHPYFGGLDLEIQAQKEEIYVRFKPDKDTDRSAPVTRYFSAAQTNTVALSIFLSAALQQGWSKLGFICMDDPVQHLDDLNIYALLDLIYSLVEHRQVIMTTASEDLYKLMLWRFAGLNQPGKAPRFRAFRMVGVTNTGPEIQVDVPKK